MKHYHPIVRGAAIVAIFVVAAEILVALTSFAWAAITVSVPFTNYIVNLGELPQWIIALVAAGGLWKSWKAEQHAAIAAVAASKTAVTTELIHKETNSMRAALEEAKLAEGLLQGRKERNTELAQQLTNDRATVRSDAVSDAETAAKIKSIETTPPKQDPGT